MRFFLNLTVVLLAGAAQAPVPKPAVPVEPVPAILTAFLRFPVVALGERAHASNEDQALRLKLIRDPTFLLLVDDIVLERGNSRYQEMVDRYVAGESVPIGQLQRAWQDVTATTEEFDTPLTEELYRAVRDVNAAAPGRRRLRIVLGDPPIEWEQVRTFEDVLRFGDVRDSFAARVIEREVLAKGRRALVIYGRLHAERRNSRANFEPDDMLAGFIDRKHPGKLFNVWTVGGDAELKALAAEIGNWPAPSLTLLRGTTLGALDVAAFGTNDFRLGRVDNAVAPISRDQWKPMRMEDQFDALLSLGPKLTLARLAPALCADDAYFAMRSGRMALAPGGQSNIDRLRKNCGR